MLKTLDIVIGVATVMLVFSMAVTIVTQFVANLMQSRGRNLREGLAGLLKQIDPNIPREAADKIAETLLKHPLVAEANGKLGEVIHREEFTTLLLGLSAGESAATLEPVARKALDDLLAKNGITDPAGTLKNIRAASLQLEAASPELANDVRNAMAILQEARSQFVAKVHGWFDQTIDRVSARFTVTARIVTFIAALLVAFTVQLDTFALVNRLSIDDQFRDAVKNGASKVMEAEAAAQKSSSAAGGKTTPSPTPAPTVDAHASTSAPASTPTATPPSNAASSEGTTPMPSPAPTTASAQTQYYNLLSDAGLITLPTDWQTWWDKLNLAKFPGILLSTLLLSLGAPFWYGRLQDLLKLRSTVAQNDAVQRCIRQTNQTPVDDSSGAPATVVRVAVAGEQGDPNAVG
ncbi:MAG TPA: hypothetical protein VGQ12_18380 [Candidatus Angelobacter sp.]|jgi:hypothetical protein|nr:hypothetical protein [Candidatus Angelobacter sp.]